MSTMPNYYTKPRVGQPMRFRASPTEFIDGFVSTVKTIEGTVTRPDGSKTENWSAEIVSGATSTARITYRSEMTPDSWQPLPENDLESLYGEGFARLRQRIDALSVEPYDDTPLVRALSEAADANIRLEARVASLEAAGVDVADIKATLSKHWDAIQMALRAQTAPADTQKPMERRR